MKKLKAFTSALMVILVVFSSIYTAFAAVYIEDWGFRFEKINNGSAYEVNKYIGNDSVVNIPDKYNGFQIISVGEYAFVDTSISSVTLGKNVTEVKNGAFINVTTLTSAVLNDTLTDIGSLAFAGCTGLTELTIPASVSTIADDAFTNCDDLVIKCYTNSAAHQYAVSKNIPFVLLDAVAPTEPTTEPPTVPVTEPPTEPGRYLLGDADMDGLITIMDVTAIQRVLLHYTVSVFDEKAANVSGEELNIVDVTLIQRHLVNIPIPYAVGEWFACDE